jgi:putative toxin-antitoxin system antitoxin component (TIGR02293 family)
MANSIKSKTGVRVPDEPGSLKRAIGKLTETSRYDLTWLLMGGKSFIRHKPKTSLEFYGAVKRGVPKLSIDFLALAMKIPMTKMAELLSLSYKTLTRKGKEELLDVPVSSQAYEMASTIAKGVAVFEDDDRFARWLHKENRALNGAKPLDLFDSSTGIRLVDHILDRIEEGIYS